MRGSMASSSSVQWMGPERELSSHAFPLTLTFPVTDGCRGTGRQQLGQSHRTSPDFHSSPLLSCATSKSPAAQQWRNLPPMQETRVQSLGQKELLEKEMATHSSILAWRVPRTEEPGRLQSMGSQRARHDWATEWQPPPSPSPCLSVLSPALVPEEWPVRTAPGTPCFLASLWMWPVQRPCRELRRGRRRSGTSAELPQAGWVLLSAEPLSPLHQGCSRSVPSISCSGQASMLMSQPHLTRGSHSFQGLESNFTSWIFLSTPELHSGPIHCLKSVPAPRTEKGKPKLEEREARTWSLLLLGEVREWRRPRQCEASSESCLHSGLGWEKC